MSGASGWLCLVALVGSCTVGGDEPPGGAAQPPADSSAAPTCASYCAAIAAACDGANAQYADEAACVTYCRDVGGFAVGSDGDTDVNTLACRVYHATAAAGDPATHCPHAGPTGAGACGSWCDNYCALAQRLCGGADAIYAGAAECQTACAAFATDGAAGDDSGDTVQCRIYHLGAASTDPATHCAHGGADGGGVCIDG